MKKKRKIRVRAYAGAGTAGIPGIAGTDTSKLDLITLQSMARTKAAVDNGYFDLLQAKYGDAGKSIGSTNNPIVDKSGLAGEATFKAVGDLMGLFGTKSTATTGKEATMQSITDIGTQAANGYNIGKNFGPAGAAIGAGVGAAVGLVGRSGQKAEMTSFTDYDEGTLGTGLIGAFGNRKLRRERARIKQNAYSNRDAVRGTEYLLSEALEDMLGMNTDTFAVGGQTSSLAYVDDGELMRTPDGLISKVPERGKPTDSNLVNIPDGTRILSNTLKVPGTKYTFAQMADKMIKKRKSRGNDMYAQNAAKLNLMNDELMYNLLFELQELVKAKKGIKPKTKLLIPAAENGLNPYAYDTKFNDYDNFYDIGYKKFVNSLKAGDPASENWLKRINSGEFGNIGGNTFSMNDITRLALDRKKGPVHNAIYVASRNYMNDYMNKNMPKLTGPIKGDLWNNAVAPSPMAGPISDKTRTQWLDLAEQNRLASIKALREKLLQEREARGDKLGNYNWGYALGMLSAVPGIIADLNSKPEHFDAVYNPYAGAVKNTMARRRYDINPELEDITRNRAVSNYNASQFNTGTGANMAYRLQSAVNTDRAISSLRAKANNANNQYLGEYANMLNDLGRQWVTSTNLAVDQNARSRAAARNIQRQGLSELAQLGETYAKSRNERRRDQEMLPLYNRFLSAGFTDEDLELLRKNLRSYRTRKG